MAEKKNKKCTAKSKRTGNRCGRYAKPGFKVCHYHGAKGGAPKGSKNALATGEYESIYPEVLSEKDRRVYSRAGVDLKEEINNELKLISFRIRRMLIRVESMKAEFFVSEKVSTAYIRGNHKSQELTKTEQNTIDLILRIEEAMTRQQTLKAKLVETKHKIEDNSANEDAKVAAEEYAKMLDPQMADIWAKEQCKE